MFFSKSTAFNLYAKRALVIMATRLGAALELLLDIRYQIGLCLACNLFALLILWLFYSRLDLPAYPDETRASGKAETLEQEEKENTAKGETASGDGGPQIPIIQEACSADKSQDTTQARSRRIQEKVSFLDLRLTDTSNRSLQDSIWATPKILPSEVKTPTRKTYTQERFKDPLVVHVPSPDCNDLCSNQAERRTREPMLQEKIKAFERKNMGISPWFDGAFQPANNGPARLRRHRSFPRLRHSVLAWWAGVEQEDTSRGLPKEPDAASEFEEHSDCSVCEIIRPGDSWSAAMHDPRVGRTPTKTSHFNPATLAPSKSMIH